MQLQYFDAQEDTKSDDWNFIPIGVTGHRVSITPQRKIVNSGEKNEVKIIKNAMLELKHVGVMGKQVGWQHML